MCSVTEGTIEGRDQPPPHSNLSSGSCREQWGPSWDSSWLNKLSSLSHSSQDAFSSSFMSPAALCCTLSSISMFLLTWGAQNWTQPALKVWAHQCRGQSLALQEPLFLTQARMLLTFLAIWAHTLAHGQPAPPGPFPLGHFPAPLPPACSTAWGCCILSAGPSTWSCWTLWLLVWPTDPACPGPSAGPSCPPADQNLRGQIKIWPSFPWSLNLLMVGSIPSFRSSVEMLNKTRPNTPPWGTPLVTRHPLDAAAQFTITLWAWPCWQFSAQGRVYCELPTFLNFFRGRLLNTGTGCPGRQ